MKRKLRFLLLFILFVPSLGQAQFRDPPPRNIPGFDDVFWHWGYYFGMTFFDFKIDYKTPANNVRVETAPGFDVGLISDFRLGRQWNLRFEPGVFMTERTLHFLNISDPEDAVRKVRSNYISVPVFLKYSALRNGNMRPYITAGIGWNYNLTSYQYSVNDNSGGRFRLKKHSYMWQVGIGLEMYMYYFKFTPALRGVFALTDELVPDSDPASQWTGNLDGVRTRGIYLVLTFE